MTIQFGRTDELTNTQFAPLAAFMAYYEGQGVLAPLQSVTSAANPGRFQPTKKLEDILWSIFAGCEYLSMVNTKLRAERILAQVNRKGCFAEQSTLALALNELSQMNLTQLSVAVRQISDRCSRTREHDWRGFLLLDFDLSGLPCGKQAEGGQKGHFSEKKTSPAAN
jgi:hypothetical protein